jgi:hypothetical protein
LVCNAQRQQPADLAALCFGPKDIDVAQIYDGFSVSVIYGLESYRFTVSRKPPLDFIQDGFTANCRSTPLAAGRIGGLRHISGPTSEDRPGSGGERLFTPAWRL